MQNELPEALLAKLEQGGITHIQKPLDLNSSEKLIFKAKCRTPTGDAKEVVVAYSRIDDRTKTWMWRFQPELEVFKAFKEDSSDHEGKGHVLQMICYFEAVGSDIGPCMVMEAVRPVGWDLRRLINFHCMKQTKIPLIELRQYIGDIALGISYLHSVGFVHCDLKPSQILVGGQPDYSAKVIDFGFTAKLGKPIHYSKCNAYMAPEISKGYVANEKIDVYGIGVILYQMRTFKNIDDPNRGYFAAHPEDWLSPGHFDRVQIPNTTDCDEAMREAFTNLLARKPSARWTLNRLISSNMTELAKFMWVQDLEHVSSLREEVDLDEVKAARSKIIFATNIKPHVQCCAIPVDGQMYNKDLYMLKFGEAHNLLVLLIQRGKDFLACPKANTILQKGDWLYIAGWSLDGLDELSVKELCCEVKSVDLANVPFRPFHPEYDQFRFPANCFGAVVGPVKFCSKVGQKAVALRPEFNINLLAIQRINGTIIGPGGITPDLVIEEGDIGIVCRVPRPNGFSTSYVTDEMLHDLATRELPVATKESIKEAKSCQSPVATPCRKTPRICAISTAVELEQLKAQMRKREEESAAQNDKMQKMEDKMQKMEEKMKEMMPLHPLLLRSSLSRFSLFGLGAWLFSWACYKFNFTRARVIRQPFQ